MAAQADRQFDTGRLSGAGSRLLSGVEFLLGATIVIGHNLFQALPNEVPILFVLGLASLRLRDRSWDGFGIRRPRSWIILILLALVAAALRIAGDELAIGPFVAQIWPPNETPEDFTAIAGNPLVAAKWFAIVWTFAAIGEEFGYRGYLVNRAAGALGGSARAYWLAVLAVAVLFGLAHYWNGPAGMIGSGFAGLVFGAVYLISGRNLWACVLAHGFVDTFGIFALYTGIAS
jgi:membrane protease YdiL (CAAX protease family)